MSYTIEPFLGKPETWNQLVENSNEGTIFHRLDFLSYHRDKFITNEHHLGIFKGTTLFGIIPLGVFEEGGRRVARSPYGASYGGPVFPRTVGYSESREIISELLTYLSSIGIRFCRIVLPISCVYSEYCETFRLVLMEFGFKLVNRDISNVIHLTKGRSLDMIIKSRARNIIRKAKKLEIEIVRQGSILDFYSLLEKNYQKFETKPTHSVEELSHLSTIFPKKIYATIGYYKNQPIAGVCNFIINSRVNSSFYLAQDPSFQHLQALSLVIYDTLIDSVNDNFEWYDFGLSSNNMHGQENIFMFKESFGAVGLFRDTYLWDGKV